MTTMTVKREIPNSFAAPAVAQGYEEQLPAMTAVAKTTVTLAPTVTSESVIHDNACGPGVVTSAILSQFKGSGQSAPKIIATDIAPAMVELAAKNGPTVDARVMDAKKLDAISSGTLTHSFTNFLFVRGWEEQDMVSFASEIYRTLAPGGTAVKAVWKYHEWHNVVRDAAVKTRSNGADLIPQQPWSEEMVRDVFIKAGFDASKKGLLSTINAGVMRKLSEQEKERYLANLKERVEKDKKNPDNRYMPVCSE
ncbi:Uu.00g030910.m01.CDS01 [Anthostomella pinea]|uniref:Uu.00g030910.m01.CDS01 n=1 Tax=Anthostomella pinea TaxID=933095 RepID=A0AAI8YD59_9PEZI|nr:Uu.00g030910.m01.CDS01 [Anthostomella pinea]